VLLALGSLAGGISGGYIAGNKGLAWLHWVNVILSAILFVGCALFAPETLYKREEPAPTTLAAEKALKEGAETSQIEEIITTPEREYPEYTFLRSLKLYTNHGNLAKNFVAPWLTLRLPGVWLVMFWYAGLVGGIVTLSTVGPSIVAYPPYGWGANAGLIMVGGVIGSILGLAATALFADRVIVTNKTLKKGEYVEPEARLPVALPGLILATAGLWTFGFCAQNAGPKMWIGMQFGIGMLSFGLMQAPSVGFNYVRLPSIESPSFEVFILIRAGHRLLPTPCGRLLRGHHMHARNHQLRLEFLCWPLGGNGGAGSAVWSLWRAHGRVYAAVCAAVVVGEENADCDGEVGCLGTKHGSGSDENQDVFRLNREVVYGRFSGQSRVVN
jgi:hypothetical protein